jgi:spermidine/putrescine transport system permease protein
VNRLKKLTIPYFVWMVVLVAIPSLLIVLLSVSDLDIFNFGPFSFSLDSFSYLKRPEVITAVKNSIRLSFMAAALCLLIGYPVAYFLANLKSKNKALYVTFIILPVWSNMLLRIIAWENMFYFIPRVFEENFGIEFDLIGTDFAILLGMISMYLPFMVLPIYSVLEKMDKSLIEASKDLGANNINTFFKVVFPLSIGGVVSGIIMTLLPSMTAFALPERLSGGKTLLIGNIIEDYFTKTNNISAGSLISVILMIVIVFMFISLLRFDKEGETLI